MAISLDVSDIKPLLGTFGLGQAPSKTLPDVSNLPTPPLPPPPTPAQAGFDAYSSDPRNIQRVVNSIIPPGQSIIPDSVTAPMAAPAPPSVGFPSRTFAALTPPGSAPTPSTPALAPASGDSGVAAIPTQDQYFVAHPNQLQTPMGRGGKVWNAIAAGLIGAAGGIKGNPMAGVDYARGVIDNNNGVIGRNNAVYNAAVIQPLQTAQALAQGKANLDTTQQNLKLTPQRAQLAQDTEDFKENQAQALLSKNYAAMGYKQDVADDGTPIPGHYSPDPNSPITKEKADKDAYVQAQTTAVQSQKDLRDAQAELAKSKNDPNSPAYKQASQRLAVAQQNANAAGTRAEAYKNNYLMHAFNTDGSGNVLPGAPIISDDNGNQTVVGSVNAGSATKNQSNAAQFNDVHGALDNVDGAADRLVQAGGSLSSPGIAAALAQPTGTLNQWLQGQGVKAHLTPEERNYVQSIASAHENIQALRKSAGGTATDSAVDKLDAMIPGASTPDLDYLKGQTKQIRATAERLGKGATVASGGLTVRGQGGNKLAPPTQSNGKGAISVTAPDGSVHQFANQQAANKFKSLAGIK